MPILATSALQRMLTHTPESEDNVLIEWMLALECMSDPAHSSMRKIFPITLGGREEDGSVGNLFAEGVIGILPNTIPAASIKVVKALLQENGINESPILSNRTVRGIVNDIAKFNGILCWTVPQNTYVRKASHKIAALVEEMAPTRNGKDLLLVCIFTYNFPP